MDLSTKSADEVVEEIMRIHRSLPARPRMDDVEAALILIRNADNEEQSRLENIDKQKKRKYIPEELFNVLMEMQKHLVQFQNKQEKKEAIKLLELENYHQIFDEMIQKASKCCAPSTNINTSSSPSTNSASSVSGAMSTPSSLSVSTASTGSLSFDKEPVKNSQLVTRDDSYVKSSSKSTFYGGFPSIEFSNPRIVNSTLNHATTFGEFKIISIFSCLFV